MPNLGALLKQEIRRLAARESKAQTESLRRAATAQRRQAATIRTQLTDLTKQLTALQKELRAVTRAMPAPEQSPEKVRPMRASAIRAMRKRIGISARDLAKLLGVSELSVYNWELGKTKPKQDSAASLLKIKPLGKRQVHELLEKQR